MSKVDQTPNKGDEDVSTPKGETTVEKIFFANFFASLSKKELLPIWLILLIIIIIDLLTRFSSADIDENTSWENKNEVVQQVLTLTPQQEKELLQSLNRFDTGEKTGKGVSKHQGMSEDEQLAQQGNLNELYAKNLRYRLMGIFEQQYRFAVVLQENLLTKEREVIQIKEQDSLTGYQVQKIANNSVNIVGNNKEINLYLYKTNN